MSSEDANCPRVIHWKHRPVQGSVLLLWGRGGRALRRADATACSSWAAGVSLLALFSPQTAPSHALEHSGQLGGQRGLLQVPCPSDLQEGSSSHSLWCTCTCSWDELAQSISEAQN